MRKDVEKAVKHSRITAAEARQFLRFYETGREGYTYLEEPGGFARIVREGVMAKKKPKRDEKGEEQRFDMEIVVDAYNEDERAGGWYCYSRREVAVSFYCTVHRETCRLPAEG